MQKIKCTQKSGSNLLFPVIVVAASAYLFVNTITMLTQGKATMGTSIIFIFMYGAVFVNGLILLLNYFNKSITVSDEEIVVTDHFARKDVWKWEDAILSNQIASSWEMQVKAGEKRISLHFTHP